MTKLIIEIREGVLTRVTSNITIEPIEYVLVDWDNINDGDEFPEEFYPVDNVSLDIDKMLIGLRIDNILNTD